MNDVDLLMFKTIVRLQYMFQLRLQRELTLKETAVLVEKEKEPRFCFKGGIVEAKGNRVLHVCTECGYWHEGETCK